MHKVSIYYTNITLQSVYCIYTEASSGIVHIYFCIYAFSIREQNPNTHVSYLLQSHLNKITLRFGDLSRTYTGNWIGHTLYDNF